MQEVYENLDIANESVDINVLLKLMLLKRLKNLNILISLLRLKKLTNLPV